MEATNLQPSSNTVCAHSSREIIFVESNRIFNSIELSLPANKASNHIIFERPGEDADANEANDRQEMILLW
jgi:hypothetical protein